MKFRSIALGGLLVAGMALWSGPAAGQELHPPIAVPFELDEPGFVTLVIEKPDGTRVRNLVSETPFPAGRNVAWWDGLDDLGRDIEAAKHSVYHVPGKPVEPGVYRVRGLVRPEVKLAYQMTPYDPGNPPWRTGNLSSGWLANHTPPSAVLWLPAGAAPTRENERVDKRGWANVPLAAKEQPRYDGPQILVASHVSEGGSGLAWLDTEGNKLHGQMWLGGVWTAASQLARDRGDNPVPGVYAYTAAYWHGDKYNNNVPEIRLNELVRERTGEAPRDNRFGRGDDRPVLKPYYVVPRQEKAPDNAELAHSTPTGMTGLAVHNGLIVLSVNMLDRLLFIDGHKRQVLGLAEMKDPQDLEFDAQGRLLVLSGDRLLRLELPKIEAAANLDVASAEATITLPSGQTLVSGLDEPKQLALDDAGNIFVSEWGKSHQVKMFDAAGKPVKTFGKAGPPQVGPYDPTHMRHPNGMTVDERGRLWVAETDKAPKRVSVWDIASGTFVKAFYGPSKYGGGGNVDPADPTRFFYTDDAGGMEFKLDWEANADTVTSVYYRPDSSDFPIRGRWVGYGPQTPIHHNGRLYLTDCYTTSATAGVVAGSLWTLEGGIARPVAAAGNIRDAAGKPFPIFLTEPFKSRMPAGINAEKDNLLFAWSDRNDDGQMQPEETTYLVPTGHKAIQGVCFQNDLTIGIAAVGDKAMKLAPQGFTPAGAPLYDTSRHEVVVEGTNRTVSTGHGQILLGEGGWDVLTTPPQPFSPYGLSGVRNGKPMWSYPSMWPGLHASHIAPVASHPGMLLGTTRLLGPLFTVEQSDLGELFAILSNKGLVYIFTTDGLMVATLFRDYRDAGAWPAEEIRDADLTQVTLAEECFGPTITRLADGRVMLVGGFNGSLIRVDGLEGARRLPDGQITVTAEHLAAAQAYFVQAEAQRQAAAAADELVVRVAPADKAPRVDGDLSDWDGADWVLIDERTKQVGNWGKRPARTEAALRIAGDRLYGAIRTDDPQLLNNSGESMQNIFKTGGAIDLMIGADARAALDRKAPVPGDQRLVITQVKGQPVAVLYEQNARRRAGEPVEFTSPIRSVRFDRVEDVTEQVTLASGRAEREDKAFTYGLFEFSVPLATLGLDATPSGTLRGDIGILRGNGFATVQRVYWRNKATGLVSDLPSEAELTPALWGRLVFKPAGQ